MGAALTSPLFASDMIHPLQFVSAPAISPERALMVAVLQEAVVDWDGRVPDNREAAQDFFRSDRRDWPYSFRNICDALGLDPEAVREALADPDRLRVTAYQLAQFGGRPQLAGRSACG